MAHDEPPAALGAEDPRRLLVAPADVETVEAVAPQLQSLGPLARERVGRGLGSERAVKRGVEAGDLRQRRAAPRSAASMPSSAARVCNGASGASSAIAARTS